MQYAVKAEERLPLSFMSLICRPSNISISSSTAVDKLLLTEAPENGVCQSFYNFKQDSIKLIIAYYCKRSFYKAKQENVCAIVYQLCFSPCWYLFNCTFLFLYIIYLCNYVLSVCTTFWDIVSKAPQEIKFYSVKNCF